jgi:hypothetical protein
MQFGGPAAFYEIAATLLPVLLLGGVVLEAVKPPEIDAAASEESSDPARRPTHEKPDDLKTVVVAYQLPIVGVLVIMLEVVALDAVASGSTDWGHALIVGGGLIFGMLCVVYAVWVPWARRTRSGLMAGFSFAVAVATLVIYLALGSLIGPGYLTLFKDVAADPHPHQGSRYVSERIWLEHLIATSRYRIDRLEWEMEHAPTSAVRERVRAHLLAQRQVNRRERKALGR